MYSAVDGNGIKTDIAFAIPTELYYCPLCGKETIQRRGAIRTAHFAHRREVSGRNHSFSGNAFCDGWHYDMSEWHRSWQERFPVENREVVINSYNDKHRADVSMGRKVLEFQHSHISPEEYKQRNYFYNKAGYRVVWLFDVSDMIENGRLFYKDGQYCRNTTWKTFHPVETINTDSVDIYFQVNDIDDSETKCIVNIDNISYDARKFHQRENKEYSKDDFVKMFMYLNNTDTRERFRNGSWFSYHGKTLLEIAKTSNEGNVFVRNIKTGKRLEFWAPDIQKKTYLSVNKVYGRYRIEDEEKAKRLNRKYEVEREEIMEWDLAIWELDMPLKHW